MTKGRRLTLEETYVKVWNTAFLKIRLNKHMSNKEDFESAKRELLKVQTRRNDVSFTGEIDYFFNLLKKYDFDSASEKDTKKLMTEWNELAESLQARLEGLEEREAAITQIVYLIVDDGDEQ